MVIMLTEQINNLRAKLTASESEIISLKAKTNQTETSTLKLQREITNLTQ